jgi:predicted dehydrogenase
VYIAKPVAVDVPGVLAIEAAGKQATAKKLCFHVDYQMSTDPLNVEVAQRIWDGGLGKLLSVSTIGNISGTKMPVDAPRGTSIEGVLNRELWLRDIALGCDIIGNFDIHSIDAAIWVVKERPVAATGKAKICRPNPVGDRHDFVQLYYECQSGMPWVHQSFSIPDPELEGNKSLSCDIRGELASARICYWGKSYLRGGPKHYGGGQPVNPYEAGAKRNVAMFHKLVSEGNCENPMIKRAVDSTLTTILGREAGHRGVRLTMDDILKENKRLNVDLTGLKS